MRKYSTTLREETLFTVTGLPAGTALRLAAMDTYDGVIWGVAGSATGKQGSSGTFERIGSQVADPPSGEVLTVDVAIETYQGYWLPDAGDVLSVTFAGESAEALAAGFRYNRATGTGLSTQRLASGDAYSMQVTLPEVLSAQDATDLPPGGGSAPSAPAIEAVQQLQGALLADTAAEGPQGFAAQIDALTANLRERGFYSNGDAAAGPPAVPVRARRREAGLLRLRRAADRRRGAVRSHRRTHGRLTRCPGTDRDGRVRPRRQ